MSLAAPNSRKVWWIAGGLAALGAGIAAALILAGASGGGLPGLGDRARPETPAPAAEHAAWDFQVRPVGAKGALSKSEKAAVQRQAGGLRSLVEEVYAAVLLAPGTAEAVVKERFAPAAAQSFVAAVPKLPEGALLIKRVASIAIEGSSAQQAVARVKIAARTDEGSARGLQRSTLWLIRDGGWKVIAFEFDQTPVVRTRGGKGNKSK